MVGPFLGSIFSVLLAVKVDHTVRYLVGEPPMSRLFSLVTIIALVAAAWFHLAWTMDFI